MGKKELLRAFKFSALIGLGMLLWLSLEKFTGLHKEYIEYHPYITMFAVLIPIILSALALKERRKEQNGLLSYKEGFLTGFSIALMGVPIAVFCQWVFHTFINPDFFTDMIAYSESKGHKNATEYFNLQSYLVQSAIGPLLGGTIISAILALVFRKTKN